MKTIDVWKQKLKKIKNEGYTYVDIDNRRAKELLNVIITIEDPKKQEIEGPLDYLSAQHKWLYPSKTEISNVMFKEILNPAYDYTYGGRIFNFADKFNQINNFIIPLLKKQPLTRAAVVSVYNPIEDSNFTNTNKPGIIMLYFRIIEEKLTISAVIRSQDFFFGWPANIYQIYSLQKYVAENLNVEIGSLTTLSNSTHIFESNFEDINQLVQEEK